MSKALALAFATLTQPMAAQASPALAAQMCQWLATSPLEVSDCTVRDKSIYVKMERPKSDEVEICETLARALAAEGISFQTGWNLRAYNPATGNSLTATCKI